MNWRAARAVLLGSALLAAACGTRHIGPPPDAPSAARPLDALPGDLDLVIRLDLKRIRETLGSPAMSAISEQAVRSLRGTDQGTDALLLSALAGTDTLWLGLRPTRNLQAADSVFILSGNVPKFDPHGARSTPRFGPPVELGGNLRRYDRERPPARSAPARMYVHAEDLVISLSEAEIDSVERSFEEQRGAPALEPAEKGVLSLMARPRGLPDVVFAGSDALRRIAERAERLELTADLSGSGVDAVLSLRFGDATAAERVAHALNELRDALKGGSGRLSKLAARLQITNAAAYATVQLSIDRDELAELVNCHGSACAW